MPRTLILGGAGFIGYHLAARLCAEGHALTNSHVVHGRKRLAARTAEGDTLDAAVIGDDPATDLALVRLAARDLPVATLGGTARVGQLARPELFA